MGSYIGTANDYFNIQAEIKLKEEGVTKFEDLFMNDYAIKKENATQNYFNNLETLSNTLSIGSNAVQNKYDISSAYANYKQSQLQLMQSKMIGSGIEQKKSLLKNAYDQTFNNYQKSMQDELYLLQKDYESNVKTETDKLYTTLEKYENLRKTDVENVREQLNENAKKYAQIEGIIREMIGINDSNSDKYYETVVNAEKGTKTIKLKDLGKDEFDRILNSRFTDTDAFVTKDPKDKTKEKKYYSLADYLFDLDQDLYEFYVANKSNINKWVAGLEADDNSYSKEEREIERKQIESEILKSVSEKDATVKENVQKRLNELSEQKFNSYNDKVNAYKTLKEDILALPAKAIRPTYTINGSNATAIIHDGKNYLVSNRADEREEATQKMLYDWGIGDGPFMTANPDKVKEYDVFVHGTDKYIVFKNWRGEFRLYKMVET